MPPEVTMEHPAREPTGARHELMVRMPVWKSGGGVVEVWGWQVGSGAARAAGAGTLATGSRTMAEARLGAGIPLPSGSIAATVHAPQAPLPHASCTLCNKGPASQGRRVSGPARRYRPAEEPRRGLGSVPERFYASRVYHKRTHLVSRLLPDEGDEALGRVGLLEVIRGSVDGQHRMLRLTNN